MYELKPISKEAIPRALEKADRYRFLNEPGEAQSICLDILHIDPENQRALVTLLLALTDRLSKPYDLSAMRPEEILPRLASDYDRAYYAGVIEERRTKARLQGMPDAFAYDGFRAAMAFYEKAAALRPAGNEDALLRWNTCARFLMQNQPRGPEQPAAYVPELE